MPITSGTAVVGSGTGDEKYPAGTAKKSERAPTGCSATAAAGISRDTGDG
ncbi:MAG TPA: hypothetical protein VEX68_01290 [Bryobacteraceae bacterium]|nr:hypothetical protein [Bryobacteraceae bacterium]